MRGPPCFVSLPASTLLTAILIFAGVASGCFPHPPRPDVSGEDDAQDTVPGRCTVNPDCAHLEGPCTQGICQADGVCVGIARDIATACDDGDSCTKEDRCTGTSCAGEPYTCDDGIACTMDLCDGVGACLTQLEPGHCLVSGTCFDSGEANPSNPCQVCASGNDWSPASELPCDDGSTCTLDDTCQAGSCVGGPPPSDAGSDWIQPLFDPSVTYVSSLSRLTSRHDAIYLETLPHEYGVAASVIALSPLGTPKRWVTSEGVRLLTVADGAAALGARCDSTPSVGSRTIIIPSTPTERPGCVFEADLAGVVSEATRLARSAILSFNGSNGFECSLK